MNNKRIGRNRLDKNSPTYKSLNRIIMEEILNTVKEKEKETQSIMKAPSMGGRRENFSKKKDPIRNTFIKTITIIKLII